MTIASRSGWIVDEAVCRAVARTHVFDIVGLAHEPFGVERAPDALRCGQLGRHLGAEPEQTEALVENHCAVDGGQVRDDAAQLEHCLL